MKVINLSETEINIIMEALTHRGNEAYENGESKTLEMVEETINAIKAQTK